MHVWDINCTCVAALAWPSLTKQMRKKETKTNIISFIFPGWLEPMLDRIAINISNVITPVIDSIIDTTLQYHIDRDINSVQVGGFNWNLHFRWHTVPERERRRRKEITDPIW